MNEVIQLPKPEELAYNLNKLPKGEEYKKAMTFLATSVLDYSQQIIALGLTDHVSYEEMGENNDANEDPGP